jgi:hypothetical protein
MGTVEPKIGLERGKDIQQALCVTPADGDFGASLDSPTREALGAFKGAYTGQPVPSKDRIVKSQKELASLGKAVTLRKGTNGVIPPCGTGGEPRDAAGVGTKLKGR